MVAFFDAVAPVKPVQIRVILLLAGVLAGVLYLTSKMTGPRKHLVPLGQLTATAPQITTITAQSPGRHMWFAGIVVVSDNSVLENDQDFEIVVRKEGKEVFSKRFLASELLESNPVKRNSFLLFLNGITTTLPARDALGHEVEFQVSATIYNPRNTQFMLYAEFVDDRLLKFR